MEFANPEEYRSKIKQILITEDQIKEALKKAGERINAAYDGAPILLVSILKGAYVFLADLSREITVPCEIRLQIHDPPIRFVQQGNDLQGKGIADFQDLQDLVQPSAWLCGQTCPSPFPPAWD